MGQHVHPPNLAVQQNQDHVVDEIPNLNSERVLLSIGGPAGNN